MLFIALLWAPAFPETAPLRSRYVSTENVELLFPGGNRFDLRVNLCNGYGTMRGTYTVYPGGHAIRCTVTGYDFQGFEANSVRGFDFEENDNYAKLIYRGEPIGCAPSPATLFVER